ncbi:protein PSK SIMULATOR 1-like [Arachis duranensis]|uniref:Protein PSK SIMULATOR 1-like n=1 Tax=Arachis duranensis TaxID=130453 RepID=A0A6P4CD46_ARADU|nr:protein PSK SIMULATOR 1-like [Arachis duranensis]
MVAEAWIVKMGNQLSSNLKHALLLETSSTKSKKQNQKRIENNNKETIGILSFEVATAMSKMVHLHNSLSDSEISKLKNETLISEGVRNVVSSDEVHLLELALVEKLEELNQIAAVVSRLGKKCSVPALQGFEHIYSDIVNGVIDVKELGFLVKHMEGMVSKLDRYVNATRNLYSEMEGLNELEEGLKKFQNNHHEESKRAFEQKLMWQRDDVRHLKDVSLWNQNFDKVVQLLARTVCTMYARVSVIFGESALKNNSSVIGESCLSSNVHMSSKRLIHNQSKKNGFHSGSLVNSVMERKGRKGASNSTSTSKAQIEISRDHLAALRHEEFGFACGTSPGKLFMECLSLSSKVSKFDDDDDDDDGGGCGYVIGCEDQQSHMSSCHNSIKHKGFCHTDVPFTRDRQAKSSTQNCSTFGQKISLSLYAVPSTLGGSALSLHYANVIIFIEKLFRYPHLVGEDARDDLYQMLPTSLRLSLKARLKSYVKDLAICDAPLAHKWKGNLDGILRWLGPLAHNMIRWQSERNFEQHQIVSRTNVLLLQTLYFADRVKIEELICDLLVGLNYIWHYEHQQNALLDCARSFDFEDCLEWQLQCGEYFLS